MIKGTITRIKHEGYYGTRYDAVIDICTAIEGAFRDKFYQYVLLEAFRDFYYRDNTEHTI